MTEIKDGFYADRKQKGVYRVHDVRRRAALRLLRHEERPQYARTSSTPATIETGEQIAKLGKFYASLIKETVGEDFSAMFGPAYKGIPLATAAAASLYHEYGVSKPYFFNRKEEKDHGEGGSLVGYKPKDGDKIIIIEDVITAGTAVRETMPILYGCGNVKVNDMFISVNRCEVGQGSRQNRHHGGQRGVRHQGPRHRHRRGHPRVLKAVPKNTTISSPPWKTTWQNTASCKINKRIRTPRQAIQTACRGIFILSRLN